MAEKNDAVTKVSKALLDQLNEAIAREIQVSIQYMWQHVQWGGVKGFAVQSELQSIAVTEMKHAETIAERLYYLGGIPTTKPSPIFVGSTLKEMIEQDIKDEVEAIKLYKQIIEAATKEGDVTTAFIFKDILEQEENHHDTFTTLLEDL
ncbi:MAG: ferritin-like domain-containing protein [Dehalococcoidales bacterium]|nr:ferritin-like domain-containing protein [Dehalococcoidales bacterium]